jgi:glutaredoxin 3
MAEITIYTTHVCPYCTRAKQLLQKKDAVWTEINVSDNAELREEMIKKSGGRRTVPQIFIGALHVGGCDDLYALEKEGRLDLLLNI